MWKHSGEHLPRVGVHVEWLPADGRVLVEVRVCIPPPADGEEMYFLDADAKDSR